MTNDSAMTPDDRSRLAALLSQLVEQACKFNCDAESGCSCPAHLTYREIEAAFTLGQSTPSPAELVKQGAAIFDAIREAQALQREQDAQIVERMLTVPGCEPSVDAVEVAAALRAQRA